jgi:hypothetical protein
LKTTHARFLFAMNKNELELEKLKFQADRFHATMETIAKVATIIGWVGAIYLIMRGLESIVLAKPEAIQALATVVERLQINEILGWLGAVIGYGAWRFERKGKKRAYKVNSDLRKRLEGDDPHLGTSGLDENGHTPK